MRPDDQRPRLTIGHGVGTKTGAVETGGNGCGVADHERKVRHPFGGVVACCVASRRPIFGSTCCRNYLTGISPSVFSMSLFRLVVSVLAGCGRKRLKIER